jgi:hydroxyacylglutathione hydrolase
MSTGLSVQPIACLRDNYCYLIRCAETGVAALVDPSEAPPVLAALQLAGVEPSAILNTHHHPDHVGGNAELLARWPALAIYGHTSDRGRIPGQTHFLDDRASVTVGGQVADVLHVPGHTQGAVAFCFANHLFTGDTLFSAGCGRLFEGSPEQMHQSLQRLAGLAPGLRVWSGHEYTVANLTFAAAAEPQNSEVEEALAQAMADRSAGRTTMPSSLAAERATNPFLRAESAERFAELRRWKDQF